jgi:hypothetical protein
MQKLKLTAKTRPLVLALILLIILGWGIYASRPTTVNFQEYAPGVLPPGLKVTGQSIDIWSSKTNPFTRNKELTIQLNQEHSAISEERANGPDPACDSSAANQNCIVRTSPKNQQYIITTSYGTIDSSKAFMQEVAWRKSGTHIWITLRGNPVTAYDPELWDKVVDSFSEVHYKGIKVNHYTPGP